jgi:REP element-mobilizing transposase RayT
VNFVQKMAGTFSQVYVQAVFAVWRRENLIRPEWAGRLYAYMAEIIKKKGQKPIIINGVPDHVHLFIGLRPNLSIMELVREVKSCSSKFINENRLLPGVFRWQEGYGVFSYGQSQVDRVYKYILNQQAHHRKRTFREEYRELLVRFAVEHDERYLFEFYE